MASTQTIQQTLNWIYAFIVGRPTTGVGGFTNEPGLTSANLILSTILGPPFAWQWNRASFNFTTTAGVTDYSESLPAFGWLEKGIVLVPGTSGANADNHEMEVTLVLGQDLQSGRPYKIAPYIDDGAGNITFRLFPAPDQAYTITVIYQQSPPLLTATTSQTWAPIPDKLSFLYQRGLKGMMHGMYSAQLYLAEMSLFFRQLVGASEGLTDSQKSIFLEDTLRRLRTEADAIQGSQQGRSTRLTQ